MAHILTFVNPKSKAWAQISAGAEVEAETRAVRAKVTQWKRKDQIPKTHQRNQGREMLL